MTKVLKKLIQPSLLLGLILLLVLATEAYLLYSKVYRSLNTDIGDVRLDSSVVRLDLANYTKTLNLLDSQQNFVPNTDIKTNMFK